MIEKTIQHADPPTERLNAQHNKELVRQFQEVIRLICVEQAPEVKCRLLYEKNKLVEQLLEINRKLIYGLALRYRTNTMTEDDFWQIGCIALIEAAETFDFSRSTEFSTHAVWTMRGALRNEFIRASKDIRQPFLLPVERNDHKMDELLIQREQTQFFEQCLNDPGVLTAQEALVLRLKYYGELRELAKTSIRRKFSCSNSDIAKRLGVSYSTIAYIEKRALKKLRRALKRRNFEQ